MCKKHLTCHSIYLLNLFRVDVQQVLNQNLFQLMINIKGLESGSGKNTLSGTFLILRK